MDEIIEDKLRADAEEAEKSEKRALHNPKKKVATDYKGKHFVIQDEDMVDEFESISEFVDVNKVIAESLESHVADCLYYGIPAYIGDDADLIEKIAIIEKKLINEQK